MPSGIAMNCSFSFTNVVCSLDCNNIKQPNSMTEFPAITCKAGCQLFFGLKALTEFFTPINKNELSVCNYKLTAFH